MENPKITIKTTFPQLSGLGTTIKTLLLLLLFGLAFTLLSSIKTPVEAAVGNPPTLNLPYASGTTGVSMGISGLHAGNFSGVPGYPYVLNGSSSVTNASLDIGFVGQSSTSVHAVALANGTVLIGYGNRCNMVLIDYGDAGNGYHLWGEYIHMGNIPSTLTTGSVVTAGQVLGTPTTNYVCGETGTSNFVHTHFAFLYGSGTTGTYQDMTSTALCGHTVLSNASAPNHGGTIDNLQGLTSAFTIPTCSSPPPGALSITSGINITSSPIALGQTISGNYTVKNTGGSSFNLSELNLWATDPNGNFFKIYGDGNSTSIGSQQSRTLTIPSGTYFGSNCSGCTSGTYLITAYWQQNGPPVVLNQISGGSNPISVNVYASHASIAPNIDGRLQLFSETNGGVIQMSTQSSPGSLSWSNQTSFATGFDGDPAATLNNNGILELFERDPSGNIYHTWQNSGGSSSWSGFQILNSGTTFSYDPTVYQSNDGSRYVLGVGTDGNVYYDRNSSSGWSGWIRISSGVSFVGKVAGVLNSARYLEIFVRDNSNNLWHDWLTGSTTWSAWVNMGGGWLANSPYAVQDPSGQIEVFVTDTNGNVDHIWQNSAGSSSNVTWSSWQGLNTGNYYVDMPVAATNSGGNTEVFVRGSNGYIYHNTFVRSSGWTGWSQLNPDITFSTGPTLGINSGGYIDVAASSNGTFYNDIYTPNGWSDWHNDAPQFPNPISITKNTDGRLQAFTRDGQGSIETNVQESAGSSSWSNWTVLATNFAGDPFATTDSNGDIEIFARDPSGNIYNDWQNTPGSSSWSGFSLLSSSTTFSYDPTAYQAPDGSRYVFAIGSDGNVYYDRYNNGWSGWTAISSGVSFVGKIAGVLNSAGYLEIFVRDSSNNMWHDWLTGPTTWSAWVNMGGGWLANNPYAVQDPTGQIEVFVTDTNGNVDHIWQNSAGSSSNVTWSSWSGLNTGNFYVGAPVAGKNATGNMEVFVRGNDGYIYHDIFNNGWSGWSQLNNTNTFSSSPYLGVNNSNNLDIFAENGNSDVFHNQYTVNGWNGWISALPSFFGNSSITKNTDGRLQSFVRDDQGFIETNVQTSAGSSSWSNWTPLVGSTFVGDPAAVTGSNGNIEVFTRDSSENIVHNWQNSPGSSSWNGWQTLNSGTVWFAYDPTAYNSSDGSRYVFAVGNNGNVYYDRYNNGWSGWTSINPSGIAFVGKVAGVLNTAGYLEIFVRDSNNNIWHNWLTSATTWNGWVNMGNTYASDPFAVQDPTGQIEVFASDFNGNVNHIWQNSAGSSSNVTWSSWQGLNTGSTYVGKPIAATNASGNTEVFVRGIDGYIYHDTFIRNGAGWTGWSQLNADTTTFNMDPQVGINNSNYLDVFGIAQSGSVYHNLNSPGGWSDWQLLMP